MLIKRYFKPTMYTKDLFNFDLEQLKQLNVKNILIDLDNTISAHNSEYMDEGEKQFLDTMQSNFNVVIVSNNHHARVQKWVGEYEIKFYGDMRKPLKFKFNKVIKNANFEKSETIIIGDQILTDVCSANRLKIKSLLVKQKTELDISYTKFNRVIERKILSNMIKKNIFNKDDKQWN